MYDGMGIHDSFSFVRLQEKHCTKIGLRAPKRTMLDYRALLWIPCSHITVPESMKTRYNKKLRPSVPSFLTCFCLRN